MLAFRQAVSRKDIDRDILSEKMTGVPTVVVDSLLSRFTETSRGSTKWSSILLLTYISWLISLLTCFFSHQATSSTKTSLLTHIFALCLKVDNYAANTTLISQDLSMKTSECVLSWNHLLSFNLLFFCRVNQLFKLLGKSYSLTDFLDTPLILIFRMQNHQIRWTRTSQTRIIWSG